MVCQPLDRADPHAHSGNMQTAEAGPSTVDDYMQLPDGGPRYEWIEEALLRYHELTAGSIFLILGPRMRKHRSGQIYSAPVDVTLDDLDVLQPGILYFSNARRVCPHEAAPTEAPELAIETLSPAVEKRDRIMKRNICPAGRGTLAD